MEQILKQILEGQAKLIETMNQLAEGQEQLFQGQTQLFEGQKQLTQAVNKISDSIENEILLRLDHIEENIVNLISTQAVYTTKIDVIVERIEELTGEKLIITGTIEN